MSLLHVLLGVMVGIAAALIVGWTLALAAGDAEALADGLSRVAPGYFKEIR